MTLILAIDDQRHFDGAHIVKTYNEGIAALASQHWDLLYLDHDLGDFSGPDGREMTGYDVMCWIEANPEHLPDEIILVTDNASGRPRMKMVCDKLYGRLY
jgi:CheY-like chemotaxis protein